MYEYFFRGTEPVFSIVSLLPLTVKSTPSVYVLLKSELHRLMTLSGVYIRVYTALPSAFSMGNIASLYTILPFHRGEVYLETS